MGQKINKDRLAHYIKQWSGIEIEPNETLEQYVTRVHEVSSESCFPFDTFYVMNERCSFLEAVLLGRKRSLLWNTVDQMQDVVVIGIEQSTAFTGKDSVFCAFRFDDVRAFSDNLVLNVNEFVPKKGFTMATHFEEDGSVVVAISLGACLPPPF